MTIADHVAMPPNGGTTMLFAQPVALQPPTIQLGNTGIDPPAQIPQRNVITAQMAVYGRKTVPYKLMRR